MLNNIIVFLMIAAMVAGAVIKIAIDKKNGVRCSGCPNSKACSVKGACDSQANKASKIKIHAEKEEIQNFE